jgi:hypothetical protein
VGSGAAKEEAREVGPFTAVEVSGAIEAVVARGDKPGVTVSGDDNIVPLVVTEVRDGRLVVRVKEDVSVNFRLPLRAQVTAAELTEAVARGASTLKASAVGAGPFEARAEGASKVEVEGLDGGDVTLSAQGASTVSASGTAVRVKVRATGASTVRARGLAAEEAEAEVTGASQAAVRPSKAVRGAVSGASHLDVVGKPEGRKVSTSGASGVTYDARP